MDYGRPPAFGGNLTPTADFPAARATAQTIDRAGLDFIGIQDHPYQRRFFDTWTLIASLVPLTERAHFVTDVVNLPLRPAPMLAKAAASFDVISEGASSSASAPAVSPRSCAPWADLSATRPSASTRSRRRSR